MRRITTTKINETIANNLAKVEKAEIYNKTSRKTEIIDVATFKENFDFLCESGCFANCVGWHYEKDHKSDSYIIESGRMDPNSEIIITAYLRVANGASNESVEKELLFIEEE